MGDEGRFKVELELMGPDDGMMAESLRVGDCGAGDVIPRGLPQLLDTEDPAIGPPPVETLSI